MIRNVKIVFLMDSDLRASILKDLSFENAGVDDEGVQYASLENYKEVKGLTRFGRRIDHHARRRRRRRQHGINDKGHSVRRSGTHEVAFVCITWPAQSPAASA